MQNFDPRQLGAFVRLHRKRSGLSQRALADIAGIGKTAVFDIEKGKLTVRFNTMLAVFKVLNISFDLHSRFISSNDLLTESGGK